LKLRITRNYAKKEPDQKSARRRRATTKGAKARETQNRKRQEEEFETTNHAKLREKNRKQRGRYMGEKILFKAESYRIIGACFEVYKEMGPGFLEAVYQECLAMEFTDQEIPFIEQPKLPISFKSRPLKKSYEADFLCFDAIIVEIKAVKTLTDDFRAQTINYLKATKKPLGLLVNFGHYPDLEYERFVKQPGHE